jgi:hypothetical protein
MDETTPAITRRADTAFRMRSSAFLRLQFAACSNRRWMRTIANRNLSKLWFGWSKKVLLQYIDPNGYRQTAYARLRSDYVINCRCRRRRCSVSGPIRTVRQCAAHLYDSFCRIKSNSAGLWRAASTSSVPVNVGNAKQITTLSFISSLESHALIVNRRNSHTTLLSTRSFSGPHRSLSQAIRSLDVGHYPNAARKRCNVATVIDWQVRTNDGSRSNPAIGHPADVTRTLSAVTLTALQTEMQTPAADLHVKLVRLTVQTSFLNVAIRLTYSRFRQFSALSRASTFRTN